MIVLKELRISVESIFNRTDIVKKAVRIVYLIPQVGWPRRLRANKSKICAATASLVFSFVLEMAY